MPELDFALPYPSQRAPVLARNLVATSQPLAAQAGLRMLLLGGNAMDAALATAIALTVVEPTSNGVGSDAFAMVWDGRELHGLNASGRSPAAWDKARFAGMTKIPARGWDSVTVPGAVSAWVAASRRFGKLPFAKLFEPAIDYARNGFAVSPVISANWARGAHELAGQPGFDETFLPGGKPPRAGQHFVNAPLARTLAAIAESEGHAFYEGHLAEAMTRHAAECGGAMTMADLAAHRADWTAPISQSIGDVSLHEMPPNGQGIAALTAVGLLSRLGIERYTVDSVEALHLQIEAMKMGLADADAFVADPRTMKVTPSQLLDDSYLAARAALIDPERAGDYGAGAPRTGGTVFMCAADASGMMVSFIQSNFEGFGSGVVVPGTGISLQNRGIGFTLEAGHANEVGPSKRPFHTIIPAMVTRGGKPVMAMGIQGGPMQSQGHLQFLVRTQLFGQNPQAASDAPRWRAVKGLTVAVEPNFPAPLADALAARGHQIQREKAVAAFGGAQMICRTDTGYVGGSDHRKDGCVIGF